MLYWWALVTFIETVPEPGAYVLHFSSFVLQEMQKKMLGKSKVEAEGSSLLLFFS